MLKNKILVAIVNLGVFCVLLIEPAYVVQLQWTFYGSLPLVLGRVLLVEILSPRGVPHFLPLIWFCRSHDFAKLRKASVEFPLNGKEQHSLAQRGPFARAKMRGGKGRIDEVGVRNGRVSPYAKAVHGSSRAKPVCVVPAAVGTWIPFWLLWLD